MITQSTPAGGNTKWDRAIDLLRRQVKGLRIINGANYGVKHHQDGQELIFETGKGGATTTTSNIHRFIIAAIHHDYFTARRADNAGADAPVTNIAKPPNLRVAAGASTSERTVNVAARGAEFITVTEKIEPAYAVGSSIIAVKLPEKTGVTVASVELEYEDTNNDARHWKTQLTIYPVCVDGVQHEAAFAAGPLLES